MKVPSVQDEGACASEAVQMTSSMILAQCKKHQGYSTPELNEKLYLHHFGFTQLNGLEAFAACTVLYLSHNALTSLAGLEALHQLDSLYLACNTLTSLKSMPLLPALHTLDVSENALTTLAGLDGAAPQLRTLLASRNRLTHLAGLRGCASLMSLDLSHNALEDAEKTDAALRPLRPSLRTLLLQGNEVCRHTPHYRKRTIAAFPNLRFLDEYPVFDEERERAEAFVAGGATAEEAVRSAQRARTAAATQEQFAFFGAFRESNREARRRNGPTHTTTAYYQAHSVTQPNQRDDEEDDEDAIYVPGADRAAGVHADPSVM